MKKIQLEGDLRKDLRKAATHQLRKENKVPAIFYGKGEKNIPISLCTSKVLPLVNNITPCFIELKIADKTYRCICNTVDYHPLTDKPIHMDLLAISNEREIQMEIPLVFQGQAPGIIKGGKLVIKKRTLAISALPQNMPSEITVDISSLELGEKVDAQAATSEKYTVLAPSRTPLAIISIPRALRTKKEKVEESK